jgi:hypothetical protein
MRYEFNLVKIAVRLTAISPGDGESVTVTRCEPAVQVTQHPDQGGPTPKGDSAGPDRLGGNSGNRVDRVHVNCCR